MSSVTLSSNTQSPSTRVCVVNPKTLKQYCASASCKFVRLTCKECSIILPTELDIKVPLSKCFIPPVYARYLGETAVITAPYSLPVLESLRIVPAANRDDKGSNHLNRLLQCTEIFLNGNAITSDQPVVVPVNGRPQTIRVFCSPREGVFVLGSTTISQQGDANKPVSQGFKLIGGLNQVIEKLKKNIERPLIEMAKYATFGLSLPKGILLYGPPGTGKTLLMKALGDELPDVHICIAKGTDLCGSDSESKIHDMFSDARQKAVELSRKAVVLFIDEIDSLCPARDSSVSEFERRAVAAVLTEMDGMDEKTSSRITMPIIVVGATNRPNSIDPALRRPGRFDFEIEIGPPDIKGRVEILEVFADTRFAKVWRPTSYELDEIAGLTHGFVGADLLQLVSQGALAALEIGSPILTQAILLSQLATVRPSALRQVAVTVPKTSWNDIGGYDTVKAELKEMVIWPLMFTDEFRRMSIDPPRGILLYGPPGCSKTMLARAVASESSMNFIAIKGPEIFSKWVGDSEQAVRDIFTKARQASPTILFFDEIDAIATQREGNDGGVSNRVLTQLLTEMDGISSLKQVIVIAATNRPHVLDPALLRPGRLDRLVYVGLPDTQARDSIIQQHLAKIPNSILTASATEKSDLSDLTKGYTGAEIVMVMKEAAIRCIRRTTCAGDLESEFDKMSLTPGTTESVVTQEDIHSALFTIRPRTDSNLIEKLMSFSASIR